MLKVILTGSTGMVGEGVLLECLSSKLVEKVLVINRKTCGYMHPKLEEIIHSDFYNISELEGKLSGYNACLFCLGTTSVGKDEGTYTKVTYTLTMHFARTLSRLNPDMSFLYISGAGTDSSEKGRMMWARVKGKTENDLMKLSFKHVFAFRPGILKPSPGQRHVLKYYKYFAWMYPILRMMNKSWACSLSELGKAMIYVSEYGYTKKIMEVRDVISASVLMDKQN